MVGIYQVRVQNKKVQFNFELHRNITIIRGDSATGKTTLVDMVRNYENFGQSSGINIQCDKPCRVLEGINWKEHLNSISDSIVFMDEGNEFIVTEEFASAIKSTDNYYVLVTRENLYNIPYSVDEIYEIKTSGKYGNVKRTYNDFHKIYSNKQTKKFSLDAQKVIITEDSKSGYHFFEHISTKNGIQCVSADGKSNVLTKVIEINNVHKKVLIIADGSAFGSEMSKVYRYQQLNTENVTLYLPESFEWILLKSNILGQNQRTIVEILKNPSNYIESKEYFSWEQYFTALLIATTKDTYMQYRKSSLSKFYLQDEVANKVVSFIQNS